MDAGSLPGLRTKPTGGPGSCTYRATGSGRGIRSPGPGPAVAEPSALERPGGPFPALPWPGRKLPSQASSDAISREYQESLRTGMPRIRGIPAGSPARAGDELRPRDP